MASPSRPTRRSTSGRMTDVLQVRATVSVPGSLRLCKDCYPEGHGMKSSMVGASKPRPAPHPGPRCATHHRERKNAQKEAAWARGIKERYGITPEQYWALYAAQGGSCYICQRATGKVKRLAVDHDHANGYVRGLLCGVCNKLLGHMRDDPDMAYRVADYLVNPPAFNSIGKVKAE